MDSYASSPFLEMSYSLALERVNQYRITTCRG